MYKMHKLTHSFSTQTNPKPYDFIVFALLYNIELGKKEGNFIMYIDFNEKKRYPIWLWKKLRLVVNDMTSIRPEHKEQFI